MKWTLYLITFLVVYYNAPEPRYDIYTYEEEQKIEHTCAEGVTKEECEGPKAPEEQKEEKQVIRYDSYYGRLPYVYLY